MSKTSIAIEIPKNSNNDLLWHAPLTNSKWISDHEVLKILKKGKFSFDMNFALSKVAFQNPYAIFDIRAIIFFAYFSKWALNINCPANQPMLLIH